MVSNIINSWLDEGFSESSEAKKELRSKTTSIPILINDKGIIQTPKPLFTSLHDETKLDPDFLPKHLEMLVKKLLHGVSTIEDSYKLNKMMDQEKSGEDVELKHAFIEYDRKSIFLSRVMFNLFEMPDSSVAKASDQYYKVVERNDSYQKALERHNKFPETFKEQCLQTDLIDLIEKQIDTIPMVRENKHSMVNNYLMVAHYDRQEMKTKPPPKTFKEFGSNKIKFCDFKEFITSIDYYPDILRRFQDALYVTEKTLNYNTFKNSVLEYNDYKSHLPEIYRAVEGDREESFDEKSESSNHFDAKLHLLFHLAKMKKDYEVTCIECSPVNPSVFVGGYGVSRFKEMNYDPRGMILFWNIHKCSYPEKIYYTEEVVTCLEFSRSEPYLVAVGMRYGLIALFDLRKSDLFSSVNNYSSKAKPFGSIRNVRWVRKKYAMGKEMEALLSVSMDGTICCWIHGRHLDGHVVRCIRRGSSRTEGEQRMTVAIDAAGMAMQIKPDNDETFLVGTIEGQVLQAEISDPESYSYVYNYHNGPVYDLEWSPLVPDVFITCGTDCSVHIWQVGKAKPSKSLTLKEVVLRVVWSRIKSTLFAAMSEKIIFVFDLSLNLHKEIADLTSAKGITFTFLTFCPKNNWFLAGKSDGATELYELTNIPSPETDQAEALKNTFLSDY